MLLYVTVKHGQHVLICCGHNFIGSFVYTLIFSCLSLLCSAFSWESSYPSCPYACPVSCCSRAPRIAARRQEDPQTSCERQGDSRDDWDREGIPQGGHSVQRACCALPARGEYAYRGSHVVALACVNSYDVMVSNEMGMIRSVGKQTGSLLRCTDSAHMYVCTRYVTI